MSRLAHLIRIREKYWGKIQKFFPEENIPKGRRGRKPVPAREVLEAVLWLLHTGAPWRFLPPEYPNYKTVHRRYQAWCRAGVYPKIMERLVAELQECGQYDGSEGFIDGMFLPAKGGGLEIGRTKRGKGMRIMAIVEKHGLPYSISVHAANHHEVKLVQLNLPFRMVEEKPKNLIGDKAYDSDALDEDMREKGINMIAPHRKNRKRPRTQDGRRLRRYQRRWMVERFFAWIQWQRRILIRWEFHPENFLGFVQLACITVLLRQF